MQKQTIVIASTRCVHDDKVRHSKVVFLTPTNTGSLCCAV